ncbi:MAG TPA: hypothetical protein PKA62_00870 [Thermoanaerobaculia bacterium]|nr:hypothetical protein [Thermoanaerobaculia bacterium]
MITIRALVAVESPAAPAADLSPFALLACALARATGHAEGTMVHGPPAPSAGGEPSR